MQAGAPRAGHMRTLRPVSKQPHIAARVNFPVFTGASIGYGRRTAGLCRARVTEKEKDMPNVIRAALALGLVSVVAACAPDPEPEPVVVDPAPTVEPEPTLSKN